MNGRELVDAIVCGFFDYNNTAVGDKELHQAMVLFHYDDGWKMTDFNLETIIRWKVEE